MRKSNTQNISELLLNYIDEMNIERKLKEVDIIHAWEEVLGKTIHRYTGKIYITRGVLNVQIFSPVVKSELIMMREEIRVRLNEKAGREIITEIRFL
ncbi:MAG: DUF721 domain-containing protein [Prolixibacteraceae bacterium]|nr:DUF721 domain-containing protein [Prolixibacteraceae bacterium]MBN2772822.1 DUF721 domain-containing protein [Prolixibacteraceae bacterium]